MDVTPRVRTLPRVPRRRDGRIDLDAIAVALGPERALLLETDPAVPGGRPWSYVALPTGGRLTDDGRTATWRDHEGTRDLGADPFAALDAVAERFGLTPDATPSDAPPLAGGLIGALSYDLGRRVEDLPAVAAADRPHPHLDLVAAGLVVAVDERDATAVLVEHPGLGTADLTADEVAERLARTGPAPPVTPPLSRPRVRTSLPRPTYLEAVRRILAHIAAGETFQVNLTQRLTTTTRRNVLDLYRSLRTASPAPFGACLPRPWGGLASVSPETFLTADGRTVTTRPIKGTRPRRDDHHLDRAEADALVASDKDRAENVMVVDMERNDLGRVCVPGSVSVPRLLEVEAHPTVWHLVSTVSGTLRPDVGYGALARACFPCGSVTGTPKVRALTVIESLEPVRRSYYCGAIGYVAAGSLSLSVAIRTAVVTRRPRRPALVDYGAGGGIVAQSDPAAEHAESLDKAAAFLRAVGATTSAEARSGGGPRTVARP